MAIAEVQDYLKVLAAVKRAPDAQMWVSYDSEADVLYITFTNPSVAEDAELNEDGVIVRYDENGIVIGYTFLNASARGLNQ